MAGKLAEEVCRNVRILGRQKKTSAPFPLAANSFIFPLLKSMDLLAPRSTKERLMTPLKESVELLPWVSNQSA